MQLKDEHIVSFMAFQNKIYKGVLTLKLMNDIITLVK